MTSFDMLIIIALGSSVGDVLFYPNVPIIYAILVTSVFVVLERFSAALQMRSKAMHTFFSGDARLIIREGEIIPSALRAELLCEEEVMSMLREDGVSNLGQVRRAYVELSGELGVIRYAEGEEKEGQSTTETD